MLDLDQLLHDASLPTRTVSVCLRGDLLATLLDAEEAYRQELERASEDGALQAQLGKTADDVLAIVAEQVKPLQDAANEAQRAVRDVQVPFVLRAIPQYTWTQLLAEHPPRAGVKVDQDGGINTDTFPLALLRASLIDPQPSDEQWERLLQALHLTELRRLTSAADLLSRRQASLVPFSFGASAPTVTSAAL